MVKRCKEATFAFKDGVPILYAAGSLHGDSDWFVTKHPELFEDVEKHLADREERSASIVRATETADATPGQPRARTEPLPTRTPPARPSRKRP